MNAEERFLQKRKELEVRWGSLSERIEDVVEQLDITLDAEQEGILEKRLERLNARRAEIEKKLDQLDGIQKSDLSNKEIHLIENIENAFVDLNQDIEPFLHNEKIDEDEFTVLEDFIGRESQLIQLDDWWNSPVPVASLLGLTGVGKSYLVRQWCALKQTQLGFKLIYIDSALGFLSPSASETDYAQYIIRTIAYKLNFKINDEIEETILALASKVRQSNVVLVMDHFENTLRKKRSFDDLPLGVPSKEILKFLQSFMSLSKGTGRIILVSNIRPTNWVKMVDNGYVTPIRGGNTRDTTQLGGFTFDEFANYINSKFSGLQLDQTLLIGAFMRLSGHPKSLDFFTSLSIEDQKEFVEVSGDDQPLSMHLKYLLRLSMKYCAEQEKRILILLSLLRRPEREQFISTIEFNLVKENIAEDLENLRRRSLIEYGVEQRSGFTAHAIVKEYIRSEHSSEIQSGHLALAVTYESKAVRLLNRAITELTKSSFQIIVETAYHYYCSLIQDKATFWRNQATRFSVQIGREAYFAGNYEVAKESAESFIEASKELIQTQATSRYLSDAYFYKAVNQHNILFDWNEQISDLHESLRLNPANVRAITFLIPVAYQAIRNRIPWNQIESNLNEIIRSIRLGNVTDIRENIPTGYIRVLCLVGSRTTNSYSKELITHELTQFSHRIINLSPSELYVFTEDDFIAYFELYDFLRKNNTSEETARILAEKQEQLTKIAVSQSNTSVRLWINRGESLILRANYAENKRFRLFYLTQAKTTLLDMMNYVALPSGFARLLSTVVENISFNLDRKSSLTEIDGCFDVLGLLKTQFEINSISKEEIDAATIRLLAIKSQIDSEKRRDHIDEATKIINHYLLDPERWLPLEIAELAIRVFTSDEMDSWTTTRLDQEETDNDVTNKSFSVKKNLLKEFDKKIYEAQKTTPNKNFLLLRFFLRVEYLRRNWTINDPNEPKIVLEAINLADSIFKDGPKNAEALTALVETYRIIATRTFSETRFTWAKEKCFEVINFYLQDEKFLRIGYFLKSKFLRSLLDYRGSRQVIHNFFSLEKQPYRRIIANHLFLDSVSHSIYGEVIRNPGIDQELKSDASMAVGLYKQYLDYIGKEREDIEDVDCAIRELQWIKCSAYIGSYDVNNLTWIVKVYEMLGIYKTKDGSRTFQHAQVLGSLIDEGNEIAQILGNHCIDGTMWREVGSLLSAVLFNDENRLDILKYFWEISDILLENSLTDKQRSKNASNLTQLNLARTQLGYPIGTQQWSNGYELLQELTGKQRMPWIYWRFVLELKEGVETFL